jgi:hypothetical protein
MVPPFVKPGDLNEPVSGEHWNKVRNNPEFEEVAARLGSG